MKKFIYLIMMVISISFTSCSFYRNDPCNTGSTIVIVKPGYPQHVSGKVFDKRVVYECGPAYFYLYVIDIYNYVYHVEVSESVWYCTKIEDYVSF